MTTLWEMGEQPFLSTSSVPSLLHRETGWDLGTKFVASVLLSRMESMESATEQQKSIQHPIPDLTIPFVPVAE